MGREKNRTARTLPAGSFSITATYSGSALLHPATSPAESLEVAKAETSSAIDPVSYPTAVGEPVTLTARVTAVAPSAGTPNGQVTFRSGTTTLGKASLSGGAATITTTALPVGPSVISVSYAGSGSYHPSGQTLAATLQPPTEVTAEPLRSGARVSFAPPVETGGSPLTSFTVTASDLTDPDSDPVTAEGWWTPIEIGGLTPGHSYAFTVRALNEVGDTATSEASDPVTPLIPCPTVDGLSERLEGVPGVYWHGCDLTGADLSGLDLTGADVSGASLRNANLTGARLGASDLTGSDFTNADLTGVSFAGGCAPGGFPCYPNANLTAATYCNTTMPDGTVDNSGCTV